MLKQRIITALLLLPIVLFGLFGLDAKQFDWFVAGVVIIGAWEWARLSGFDAQLVRCSYALLFVPLLWLADQFVGPALLYLSLVWWALAIFLVLSYPGSKTLWLNRVVRLVVGGVVLIPFWVAMVFIRSSEFVVLPEINVLWVLLYSLVLIWAADIGAYFAGRAFGRRKLAVRVSPGKSWEGVWGGMALAGVFSVVVSLSVGLSFSQLVLLLVMTLVASAVSVVGDLTESMFKREAGVKDSSQLLPGHGGIMDRIDSLTAAVPVFACLLLLAEWMHQGL